MSGRLTIGKLRELATNEQLSDDTEIVITDASGEEISLPDSAAFEIDDSADEPQVYVNIGKDVSDSKRLPIGSIDDDDDEDEWQDDGIASHNPETGESIIRVRIPANHEVQVITERY